MITAKTDLKMAAGTEGCYRVTITDAGCPAPRISNVEVNGAVTTPSSVDDQGVTGDVGVVYTDPFVVNTQGIATTGTDTSLEAYKMRFS